MNKCKKILLLSTMIGVIFLTVQGYARKGKILQSPRPLPAPKETIISREVVLERIKQLEAAINLEEGSKNGAIKNYNDTLIQIEIYDQYNKKIQELDQEILNNPREQEILEKRLSADLLGKPFKLSKNVSLFDAKSALDQSNSELAAIT